MARRPKARRATRAMSIAYHKSTYSSSPWMEFAVQESDANDGRGVEEIPGKGPESSSSSSRARSSDGTVILSYARPSQQGPSSETLDSPRTS